MGGQEVREEEEAEEEHVKERKGESRRGGKEEFSSPGEGIQSSRAPPSFFIAP